MRWLRRARQPRVRVNIHEFPTATGTLVVAESYFRYTHDGTTSDVALVSVSRCGVADPNLPEARESAFAEALEKGQSQLPVTLSRLGGL